MIKEILERDDEGWRKMGHVNPLRTLILDKGEVFTPAPFADYGPRGEQGACWSNACELALQHPKLRYVEGYGIIEHVPIPIMHAWCVDEEGKVVDSTWETPEKRYYMGVVLPTHRVVTYVIKKGFYGVLTNLGGEMVDLEAIEYFFPEYKGRDWAAEGRAAKLEV